jgi:RNA polymerase sigma-70 factor (ECF subfamily)
MDAATDEELLGGYSRGDTLALDELIRRHFQRAYRIAYRVLGDAHSAEDCAQEAMARIASAAGRYTERGAFQGFLYRVVVNTARNHEKSRRRRTRHEERAAKLRPDREEPMAEKNLAAEEVAVAVEDLPEDLRLPIVLHYYEGLTQAEVASALTLREGTAASRLRRGLEHLRSRLATAGAVTSLSLLEPLLVKAGKATTIPAAATPSAASVDLEARRLARLGSSSPTLSTIAKLALPIALLGVVVLAVAPWSSSPPAPPLPPGGATSKQVASSRASKGADSTVADDRTSAREVPANVGPGTHGTPQDIREAGAGAQASARPGARIAGFVIGPDEQPFPGATVKAESAAGVAYVATSDAEGHFEIARIATKAPEEILTVSARDRERLLLGSVTFAEDGTKNVQLELLRGGFVEGHALDRSTGEPQEAVALEVEPIGGRVSRITVIEGDTGASQADGSFKVGPLRAGEYRLIARDKGRTRARTKPFRIATGETTQQDVELASKLALTGRVLDPDGHPVENAVVGVYCGLPRDGLVSPEGWIENECAGRSLEKVFGRRLDPKGSGKGSLLGEDGAFATTDRDGRFQLDDLLPGKRQLIAVHPGYATAREFVSLKESLVDVEIKLERGGEVHGFARTKDGRSASGGMVMAATLNGGARFGVVDASGTYSVAGLESGQYVLLLVEEKTPSGESQLMNPFAADLKTIRVSFRKRVRFDLGPAPAGSRVAGQVTKKGAAVTLSRVSLTKIDEGESSLHALIEDGRYTFQGVDPGRYVLSVHEALAGTVREVRLEVPPGGGEVSRDLDLVTGSIEGRAVAAAGTEDRRPGIVVAVEQESGKRHAGVIWPGHGFSVDGLSPGTYRLQAALGGVCSGQTSSVTVAEGQRVEGVEIPVASGAALEVVVLDSEGDPCSGARATVVPAGEEPLLDAARVSDALGNEAGLVRLKSVPDGRFDVYAMADGRPVGALLGQELGEDASRRHVTVRLGGAATLDLIVRDSAGQPVEGASLSLKDSEGRTVYLSPLDPNEGVMPKTGKDGKLELSLLPAGRHVGTVRAGSKVATVNVDLSPGRNAEVSVPLPE